MPPSTRRLVFFQEWIDKGEPMVYWISGFYFTQSFITGVLQNYSRKNRFQIDMILIEFAVTKFESTVPQTPEVGAYIRVSLLAGLLSKSWYQQTRLELC